MTWHCWTQEAIKDEDIRAPSADSSSPLRSGDNDISAFVAKNITWKRFKAAWKPVQSSAGKRFLASAGCLSSAELRRVVICRQKGKLKPGCGFIHPRWLWNTQLGVVFNEKPVSVEPKAHFSLLIFAPQLILIYFQHNYLQATLIKWTWSDFYVEGTNSSYLKVESTNLSPPGNVRGCRSRTRGLRQAAAALVPGS